MAWAASAIACRPEEQSRVRVYPGTQGVQPRTQGDEPPDVGALNLLRTGTAHDNVVDLHWIQLGDFLQHAFQQLAGEVHRMGKAETALFCLGNPGAAIGDHDRLFECSFHVSGLISVMV